MGPRACSSSDSARPSQKSSSAQATLRIVGVFRPSSFIPCPIALGKESLQEKPGLWQVAQAMDLEPDKRGSKKRVRPSSSRCGVKALSAGNGIDWGRTYFTFHSVRL